MKRSAAGRRAAGSAMPAVALAVLAANTPARYCDKTILDAANVDPTTIKDWPSLTAALARPALNGGKSPRDAPKAAESTAAAASK